MILLWDIFKKRIFGTLKKDVGVFWLQACYHLIGFDCQFLLGHELHQVYHLLQIDDFGFLLGIGFSVLLVSGIQTITESSRLLNYR